MFLRYKESLFLGLLVIYGCTTNCKDCEPSLSGREFLPIEIGHFVEYDVTETQVIIGRPAVNKQYQLKELIAESYADAVGQRAYRVARFRRDIEGQRWQPDSTITFQLKIDHAIRNENGRDFVKMMFPVTEKTTWNGNIYNNLGEDSYELKNVNKPIKIGETNFEKTATIIQQSDSTLVNQDKRIEVYAANVGLVYRERINMQYCSSTPACIGKAQIDFGTKQYIRFKRSGKE